MSKFNEFLAMVDALGDDATERQKQRLVEWIVHNLPRHEWEHAASVCCLPGVYTIIRQRMAEWGF